MPKRRWRPRRGARRGDDSHEASIMEAGSPRNGQKRQLISDSLWGAYLNQISNLSISLRQTGYAVF